MAENSQNLNLGSDIKDTVRKDDRKDAKEDPDEPGKRLFRTVKEGTAWHDAKNRKKNEELFATSLHSNVANVGPS